MPCDSHLNECSVAKRRKNKIRAEFRKKHDHRKRRGDLTRDFREHGFVNDDSALSERVSGKGELTRKRTVIGEHAADDQAGFEVQLAVDETSCVPGRVLRVHGLESTVQLPDGRQLPCTVRGILRSMSTDQRHVVVAGDQVLVSIRSQAEGVIERIEPRRTLLSRTSRGRQHVLAANADQLLIVSSAARPSLKPHLIDRLLITAEKSRVKPIICINKIDLIRPADLQPLAGVYGQMGYEVLLVSATDRIGLQPLKQRLQGRASVVLGQSGVGKSSILNAIDPTLKLPVREVSAETEKGKHTTTAASLIGLAIGGHIFDTPGIRQFQLWDVIPEEVEGYFRDLRPYLNLCKYPDCTHVHEDHCAVKDAVADGRLDARRYESYCQLLSEP